MPLALHPVTDAERTTYEAIWSHDAYGAYSPGVTYCGVFLAMTGAEPGDTVLDAGCGSGQGALALQGAGLVPWLTDLTDAGLDDAAAGLPFIPACLWRDHLPRLDWVYCCDVLEHLPLPFTMLVVQRLLDAADRGLFLSIALVPDSFGILVGTPLHQSVQSFVAWRDQLSELGELVECRDLGSTGLYFLRNR